MATRETLSLFKHLNIYNLLSFLESCFIAISHFLCFEHRPENLTCTFIMYLPVNSKVNSFVHCT